MKPYSEDLRLRIVRAVEGGTSKSAAARLFGVSLSSVKRYLRIAQRGVSLAPRKGGGRPPKTDRSTEKLLTEDVKERPAATVSERRRFLSSWYSWTRWGPTPPYTRFTPGRRGVREHAALGRATAGPTPRC